MPEAIDPSRNWDASLIVINAIARFPQQLYGRILVAEKLMLSYEPGYRGRTVSISEFAQIQPHPELCATAINRIHLLFGVPRIVTGEEAVRRMMEVALESMASISLRVSFESMKRGIIKPEVLRNSGSRLYVEKTPQGVSTGFGNRETAFALEGFLTEHDSLRIAVASGIREEAEGFKPYSGDYQRLAVTEPARIRNARVRAR
jgi:hypothetical protein